MSRRTTDIAIAAALRDLDPAPRGRLSASQRERAEAELARIVATPVEGPVEPERPRRHRRRLAVAALIGAVGTAGVVSPGLLGGGSAYGSWTPTPEPLTGPAATKAGDNCRHSVAAPDRGERVVIAERRGEWTFVLLAGPGTEVVCLMFNEGYGVDAAGAEGGFGSNDSTDAPAPVPSPDALVETGAMSSSTDEGWFTFTTGFVGSDVTAVTVHTTSGPDLEASVVGGRFAAWWPAIEQSSDHPQGDVWSYTLQLADGTTRPSTGRPPPS